MHKRGARMNCTQRGEQSNPQRGLIIVLHTRIHFRSVFELAVLRNVVYEICTACAGWSYSFMSECWEPSRAVTRNIVVRYAPTSVIRISPVNTPSSSCAHRSRTDSLAVDENPIFSAVNYGERDKTRTTSFTVDVSRARTRSTINIHCGPKLTALYFLSKRAGNKNNTYAQISWDRVQAPMHAFLFPLHFVFGLMIVFILCVWWKEGRAKIQTKTGRHSSPEYDEWESQFTRNIHNQDNPGLLVGEAGALTIYLRDWASSKIKNTQMESYLRK